MRVTSSNLIFSNPRDVGDHRAAVNSDSILNRCCSSLVRRIEVERAEADC